VRVSKPDEEPRRQLLEAASGLTCLEAENAFARSMEPTTVSLARIVTETVPLSRLMAEPVKALRLWAQGRARPATAAEREAGSQRKLAA
jgi:hypothetical protein